MNIEGLVTPEEEKKLIKKAVFKQQDYLDTVWSEFFRQNLTDVDLQTIKLKEHCLIGVLESGLTNLKLLLCAAHLYKIRGSFPYHFKDIVQDIQDFGPACSVTNVWNSATLDLNLIKTLPMKLETLSKHILHFEDAEKLLQFVEKLPKFIQEFLENYFNIIGIIQNQVASMAPIMLAKQKVLVEKLDKTNEVSVKNDKLGREIMKMQQQKDYMVEDKTAIIQECLQIIEKLKRSFVENQSLFQNKTEHSMQEMKQNFLAEKEVLVEKVTTIQANYNKILDENEKEYKKLSELKYKKEANLLNWLQKYDTEIGTRRDELEILEDELNLITDEYDDYKEKLVEQEPIYQVWLETKWFEDYEALIFRMRNRMATKIQKWFRKEMKRIKKKRKKAAKKAEKLKKRR